MNMTDPVVLWIDDLKSKVQMVQAGLISLDKKVDRMQTDLIRSNAKKFGRTEETANVITKLMMGVRYDASWNKELTKEECELLLNMLGVAERFT
jgi:hypothetical protein